MKKWQPADHVPRYPSPEDGCVFVMGGSLHGEIIQMGGEDKSRAKFVNPVLDPESRSTVRIEEYRIETFYILDPNGKTRLLYFGIIEGEDTSFHFIRAFTDLCMFMREARGNE